MVLHFLYSVYPKVKEKQPKSHCWLLFVITLNTPEITLFFIFWILRGLKMDKITQDPLSAAAQNENDHVWAEQAKIRVVCQCNI